MQDFSNTSCTSRDDPDLAPDPIVPQTHPAHLVGCFKHQISRSAARAVARQTAIQGARSHRTILLERTCWLPAAEQALVRAVLERGQSTRDAAALLGLRARQVRDRLRRIARRVMTPLFALVALEHHLWEEPLRRVGIAVVLHGLTMRAAARQLGLTFHTVRARHDAILALLGSARRRRARRPATRALPRVLSRPHSRCSSYLFHTSASRPCLQLAGASL